MRRIINALSWLDKKKSGTIAVFDFGGGTFDISILELSEGVFEVKSTSGDTPGGDDLDKLLVDYVADDFNKETAIDIHQDAMALHHLAKPVSARRSTSDLDAGGDQPARSSRAGRGWAQAPHPDDQPGEVRAADRAPRRAARGPSQTALRNSPVRAERGPAS